MDRRRVSLVLLLLFVACTGAAIVIGGSRPALQQGVAPAVAQFAGYLFALVAAGLLMASPDGGAVNPRRLGATVLAALGVLVLLDLLVLDDGGPNIGAGFVRLVGLVVMVVVIGRLAREVSAPGRTR
jgi:peptidoglycan/LPS O-acetylase OafA/YrhL